MFTLCNNVGHFSRTYYKFTVLEFNFNHYNHITVLFLAVLMVYHSVQAESLKCVENVDI